MTTIKMVKIEQGLVPLSEADVEVLRSLNLCLTRYTTNYISTLRFFCRRAGHELEIQNFSETVLPQFEKTLSNFWSTNSKNKCSFEDGKMTFSGLNSEENIEALKLLQEKLSAFFERWGFESSCVLSRTQSKCTLNVSFFVSSRKYPVIVHGGHESDPVFDPATLDVGNYRITLEQHDDGFGFSFSEKVNGEWKILRRHNCISYTKVRSHHALATLFDMFNRS